MSILWLETFTNNLYSESVLTIDSLNTIIYLNMIVIINKIGLVEIKKKRNS